MFRHNLRTATCIAFASGALLGIAGTGIAATVLGSDVFTDVPRGSFYDTAVGDMYSDGIIKGYDGTTRFGPDDFVTRGQVAVMLQRLRDDMEGNSDDDDNDTSRSSRSSSSRSSSSSSSAMSNNPKGTFRFTTGAYTVDENKTSLTIGIVRVGGNQGAVTVDYTLNAGSASAGSDYEALTGTLSFASKETSKTFTVTIKNDSSSEGNETFTIALSNPGGGASIGSPTSATVTIVDDESGGSANSGSSKSSSASSNANGTVSFGAPTYMIPENGGNATITVVRTGGTNGSVSVDYATSNGSGQSGNEYTSVNGTLTFNSGENSKSFTVPLSDDSSPDGNKTFNVTLSNLTGGASMGTPSSSTVTIFDNDAGAEFGTGSLKFTKSNLEVTEGSGKIDVTVQRIGGTSGSVSVNYATRNGTAFSGADFSPMSGTLTFAPGESSKLISVPLVKDSTNETDDYFYLELTNPTSNALLASPYSVEILIVD